jgi:hypothetical protein
MTHESREEFCQRCKDKTLFYYLDCEICQIVGEECVFVCGVCHMPHPKPDEDIEPLVEEGFTVIGDGTDPENMKNLGPTGHGDECHSDADPNL